MWDINVKCGICVWFTWRPLSFHPELEVFLFIWYYHTKKRLNSWWIKAIPDKTLRSFHKFRVKNILCYLPLLKTTTSINKHITCNCKTLELYVSYAITPSKWKFTLMIVCLLKLLKHTKVLFAMNKQRSISKFI